MAGSIGGAIADFFASSAGTAVEAGAASAAIGTGVSALLRPKTPNINIPPPPGAAMIDPAGAQAAAAQRSRAAAAGGLQSTISGAGQPGQAGSPSGPTSGGKQLLGA